MGWRTEKRINRLHSLSSSGTLFEEMQRYKGERVVGRGWVVYEMVEMREGKHRKEPRFGDEEREAEVYIRIQLRTES